MYFVGPQEICTSRGIETRPLLGSLLDSGSQSVVRNPFKSQKTLSWGSPKTIRKHVYIMIHNSNTITIATKTILCFGVTTT